MKEESLFIKQGMSKWYASYNYYIAPDNVFELRDDDLIMRLYEIIKTSAKMTEFIDFSCNFDASDLCAPRREQAGPNKMCCCSGCYESIGYLRNGPPILKEDLVTYEEFYKKGIGFWREGSGCSLPRELRSPTCVYHMCYDNPHSKEPIYEALRVARRSYEGIVHNIKRLIVKSKENNENNKSI